jgi:hypothetical protein
VDELERLAALRRSGVLDEDGFRREKARIPEDRRRPRRYDPAAGSRRGRTTRAWMRAPFRLA